mmetsp:Transcript_18885/g.37113  ORF Transcript_18885/g.37113 Transcript_18885/m.37113 type:complete len:86 (+) Transcript_18885:190-447(+)
MNEEGGQRLKELELVQVVSSGRSARGPPGYRTKFKGPRKSKKHLCPTRWRSSRAFGASPWASKQLLLSSARSACMHGCVQACMPP